MPEVDWTPNAPGIKLYNSEDWSWMNEEGTTGIRREGAKYITFPIHVSRPLTYPTPPKRTFRQKMHDKVLSVAWRVVNHYEGD